MLSILSPKSSIVLHKSSIIWIKLHEDFLCSLLDKFAKTIFFDGSIVGCIQTLSGPRCGLQVGHPCCRKFKSFTGAEVASVDLTHDFMYAVEMNKFISANVFSC